MENRTLLRVTADVDENTIKDIVVQNEVILAPKYFPQMMACVLSTYLHDLIVRKKIPPSEKEKLRRSLLAELRSCAKKVDKLADKYEKTHGAQPEIAPLTPVRRGVQIRLGG